MSPSNVYEPRDVVARIRYLRERGDGSLPTKDDSLKILRQCKEVDPRLMTIHDIRNNIDDFTLDKNGFQLWVRPEAPAYAMDDQEIEEKEYPEIIETLKKVTGGTHARIFNHIIRNSLYQASEAARFNPNVFSKNEPRPPALRPHTDYDASTAAEFFSASNPEMARYVASGRRWQVVGIWRPLETIKRNPLALCDARSVREEDLVAMQRMYGDRKGMIGVLRAGNGEGGGHRWYWVNEQRPEEAWLFKHFDSQPGEGVTQCAHVSFDLPGTESLPPRESVEFRALVFY